MSTEDIASARIGDLDRDTAVEGGEGRFRARLSRRWEIWGPNGGYVASIALRAAAACTRLARPAGVTCHYLNVAEFDEVVLDVAELRASKRAASLRVSMTQRDRPILEALVWMVDHRDGFAHEHAPMPDVPRFDEMRSWTPDPKDPRPSFTFPFWYAVDGRMVGWPTGGRWQDRSPGDPIRQEWWRYRKPGQPEDPIADATRSLIMIDTLMFPAAAMAHADPMGYVAPSLDLSVWFHAPAQPHEWLFCEAVSPAARSGLVAGSARVWTPDGTLVASGGQQMLCRPVG